MTADNRILQFFPQRLRGDWERGSVNFEKIQEIRLRDKIFARQVLIF